ncbi:unnamed protein product, partial [Urochloa humidicola]
HKQNHAPASPCRQVGPVPPCAPFPLQRSLSKPLLPPPPAPSSPSVRWILAGGGVGAAGLRTTAGAASSPPTLTPLGSSRPLPPPASAPAHARAPAPVGLVSVRYGRSSSSSRRIRAPPLRIEPVLRAAAVAGSERWRKVGKVASAARRVRGRRGGGSAVTAPPPCARAYSSTSVLCSSHCRRGRSSARWRSAHPC